MKIAFIAALILLASVASADVLTIPAGNQVIITCNGTFVKTATGWDCVALPPLGVEMMVPPTLTTRVSRRKGNTTKRVDVTVDKDQPVKVNNVSR